MVPVVSRRHVTNDVRAYPNMRPTSPANASRTANSPRPPRLVTTCMRTGSRLDRGKKVQATVRATTTRLKGDSTGSGAVNPVCQVRADNRLQLGQGCRMQDRHLRAERV